MSVSLSELGKTLRCPKDNNFAKAARQNVDAKTVTLDFSCEKCGTKYQRKYSLNQYIRMAQAGLIDPPEIKDFQKKMIMIKGELPRIDKGLDGAFIIDEKKRGVFRDVGNMLLCKCNKFYTLNFTKFKKDKIELNEYCGVCTPKGKKIELNVRDFMLAGTAGLIDHDIFVKVKEEGSEMTKQFDVGETYSGQDGTLSTWVQEELGMAGEAKGKKCYICGAPLPEGSVRCPKCGSDV